MTGNHRKCPPKRKFKNRYTGDAFFCEIRKAITDGIADAIQAHPDWIISKAHELSYPGLAIKEGTLLNKIYRLTDGRTKGGEL